MLEKYCQCCCYTEMIPEKFEFFHCYSYALMDKVDGQVSANNCSKLEQLRSFGFISVILVLLQLFERKDFRSKTCGFVIMLVSSQSGISPRSGIPSWSMRAKGAVSPFCSGSSKPVMNKSSFPGFLSRPEVSTSPSSRPVVSTLLFVGVFFQACHVHIFFPWCFFQACGVHIICCPFNSWGVHITLWAFSACGVHIIWYPFNTHGVHFI